MVLHPGDCDLLRGLVETAVQMLEPVDPIHGFRTYRFQNEAWVAVTNRLVIAARRSQDLTGVLTRLKDPKADGLASQKGFQKLQPERKDALLFACVDGPNAVQQFGKFLRGRDGIVIKTLLDVEHLEALTAAVRATDSGLQVRARLELMDGHHSLAYALIRTAPLSKRSLNYVPAGAAAVAMIGLNPPEKPDAKPPAPRPEVYYLTGMDIGRELFDNIEEIAVFAMPPDQQEPGKQPPMPPVAAIITAKDPARSEALWNQLLALPAGLNLSHAKPPHPCTIEGLQAAEFALPDLPPIVLVRVKDRALLVGTQAAVAAAVRTSNSHENILRDHAFKPLLDRLTPDSSKAVLLHAGRTLAFASTLARGREARDMALAGSLCGNLTLSLITHERPTQLIVQLDTVGLPNVPDIIKTLAQKNPRRQKALATRYRDPARSAPQQP